MYSWARLEAQDWKYDAGLLSFSRWLSGTSRCSIGSTFRQAHPLKISTSRVFFGMELLKAEGLHHIAPLRFCNSWLPACSVSKPSTLHRKCTDSSVDPLLWPLAKLTWFRSLMSRDYNLDQDLSSIYREQQSWRLLNSPLSMHAEEPCWQSWSKRCLPTIGRVWLIECNFWLSAGFIWMHSLVRPLGSSICVCLYSILRKFEFGSSESVKLLLLLQPNSCKL